MHYGLDHRSAALFFIAVGAKIFVSFVSLTGVTGQLVELVSASGLENWQVLLCIVCIYLIMGMFLDPIGTMLLTLPFVVPLVEGMGYDLIWFGVIILLALEISFTTPPFGLLLFVMKGVSPPDTKMSDIYKAAIPYMGCAIFLVGLLIVFPGIALWLPGLGQ